MKIIPKKILGLCSSSLLISISLLVPFNAYSADVYKISAKELVYRLGEACGGDAEWKRTKGPSSALVRNRGKRSFTRLYDTGTYEFTASCCSISGKSSLTGRANYSNSPSRIKALMSSSDRMGFGANTTGGAAASSYTVVSNLNNAGKGSLRDALLEGRGPKWITFSNSIRGGTIYLSDPINVKGKDITVDGAGSGITISVRGNTSIPMLQFRGGNTIIHGITIDGNNTRSTALLLREGDDYWVDHVTIKNLIYDDGISVGQGTRKNTSASEVTISNYHAYNTNYGMIGGGNDRVAFYPPYRVTIHSSNLSARDRNPRIKNNGTVHIFNNYIHSFKYSGASAGANSVVYSQNNVFSASKANNPKMALSGISNNGRTAGRVFSSGDVFLDRSSQHGNVRLNSASSIKLPYRYKLKSASSVKSYVLANAGAAKAGNSGSDSDKDVEVAAANPAPRPAPRPTPTPLAPSSGTKNEPTPSNCDVQTKSIRFVRRKR